jgi:hypothetical protein
MLDLAALRVSKMRRRTVQVSDDIVLLVHEICGIHIAELRALVQADLLLDAARPPHGCGLPAAPEPPASM